MINNKNLRLYWGVPTGGPIILGLVPPQKKRVGLLSCQFWVILKLTQVIKASTWQLSKPPDRPSSSSTPTLSSTSGTTTCRSSRQLIRPPSIVWPQVASLSGLNSNRVMFPLTNLQLTVKASTIAMRTTAVSTMTWYKSRTLSPSGSCTHPPMRSKWHRHHRLSLNRNQSLIELNHWT